MIRNQINTMQSNDVPTAYGGVAQFNQLYDLVRIGSNIFRLIRGVIIVPVYHEPIT
jgi:hypothetical protein